MPDKKAFEAAKRKVIGIDRQRLGIGTLAEKSLHAILKNYYEPNEDRQEIPIENYVADIFADGEIIEIQTRQFDKMRGKLAAFLPLYPVTIVYPIPHEKWLIWIDEESGSLSKKRKSPRKGNPYLVFPELYKIKAYLKDPNLRLRLVLLDVEEYKLLNGRSRDKKKGASRYDRIPTELVRELGPETGWSKSTIVTMVGRLEAKGALTYTEGGRARQYAPAVPRAARLIAVMAFIATSPFAS